MKRLIYPSPIYTFLDFMFDEQKENHSIQNKILDCAAGGKQPPLGLFAEYGFDAYGIDISSEQVEKAYGFARENNLDIKMQTGDMRKIPYEDTAFDFVYEFYSICHLSKLDTIKALSEMERVLKKGGLLFVGFMSSACWPILGQEISCGEFALIENEKSVIHNVYDCDEPDDFFSDLETIYKEKRISYIPEIMSRLTLEEWNRSYPQVKTRYSRKDWHDTYEQRVSMQNYTHLFYILRKP